MEQLSYFYLLVMGLILSYYDIKNQEYPLIIWLTLTLVFLTLYPINVTFIILCLLGIFAIIKNINIGAGDFFYLATLGLLLSLNDLLWTLQFASLFGIIFFLLKLNKGKSIAFVPFLVLGYLTWYFLRLGTYL